MRIEVDVEKLSDTIKKGEISLVGKLCTDCLISKEVIRSTITKIWRVSKPFQFQEVSPNLFVITFENETDMERVLTGSPWLFDNNIFVLRAFDGLTPPQQLKFDFEVF